MSTNGFQHTDRDTLEHGRTLKWIVQEINRLKDLLTKAPRVSENITTSSSIISVSETHTIDQTHLNEEQYNFYDSSFHICADRDLTAPPGTLIYDTKYIVGGSATGNWSGFDDYIAIYTQNNVWDFLEPVEGMTVYLQDENDIVIYDSANWVLMNTLVAPDTELTQDIVGAMVSSNTETFITVTYQDSDGTLDFVVPVLDEDDMSSDSATDLPTQQSVKAYVDSVGTFNIGLYPNFRNSSGWSFNSTDDYIQTTLSSASQTAYMYFDLPERFTSVTVRAYLEVDTTPTTAQLAATIQVSTDGGGYGNTDEGTLDQVDTGNTGITTVTITKSTTSVSVDKTFRLRLLKYIVSGAGQAKAIVYGIQVNI